MPLDKLSSRATQVGEDEKRRFRALLKPLLGWRYVITERTRGQRTRASTPQDELETRKRASAADSRARRRASRRPAVSRSGGTATRPLQLSRVPFGRGLFRPRSHRSWPAPDRRASTPKSARYSAGPSGHGGRPARAGRRDRVRRRARGTRAAWLSASRGSRAIDRASVPTKRTRSRPSGRSRCGSDSGSRSARRKSPAKRRKRAISAASRSDVKKDLTFRDQPRFAGSG